MTIAEEVDDAVRALRRESYVANRSVFAERMRAYYACKAESLKAARRDRYRLNREQEKSNARAHYYRKPRSHIGPEEGLLRETHHHPPR